MKNYDKSIVQMLIKLGVQQHLSGFDYLITAIKLVIEDNDYKFNITKKLYPKIAEIHNTTNAAVERAIRHAIHSALKLAPIEELQKVFGNTIGKKGISNGHYIAAVANAVIMGVIQNDR